MQVKNHKPQFLREPYNIRVTLEEDTILCKRREPTLPNNSSEQRSEANQKIKKRINLVYHYSP